MKKLVAASVVFVVAVALLAAPPNELVNYLLHGNPPPVRVQGTILEFRSAGIRLASQGRPVLPAIRRGISQVEINGLPASRRDGLDWLLYAYAHIERDAAYPTLRRMLANPRLKVFAPEIERAAAVALGLASYRSSLDKPQLNPPAVCTVQDTFDRFIVGWLLGDRKAVEASLTPEARAQLSTRSFGKRFETAPSLRGQPLVAIGYQLAVPADSLRWPDPLRPPSGVIERGGGRHAVTEGKVLFFRDATPCGSFVVRFKNATDLGSDCYTLIDSRDLDDAAATLAACVSASAPPVPARGSGATKSGNRTGGTFMISKVKG